ncbi:MAG: P-loop NTPase fold protein [Snowella sp.]|nr:P-loop NTPase fold protein [Snowella sp.]
MSERLQRFRKLMAAFEGTSNPQHAIERGFYVDLPHNPMAEITRRIEVRPASLHLLLGGIGSGKTTQLLLAQEHLNQLEGFNAIYVDVSLYTDISKIERGALIAIAGLEIIKFLDDKKQSDLLLSQYVQAVYDSARGNKKTKEAQFPIPDTLKKLEKHLEDDLKNRIFPGYRPEKTEDKNKFEKDKFQQDKLQISQQLLEIYKLKYALITENKGDDKAFNSKGLLVSQNQEVDNKLIEAFSNLSKSALEKNGEIVFILDGLDRLNNSQIFIDSVFNDVMEILEFGVGVVLIGSIPIAYQKGIEKFSSYLHYFPYLNVAEDAEARRFFLNILTIRDSDNFITSEAKDFLITESGSVLRDLMSLTQSAIEEAYVDGSDNVKLEHAEQAVASFARSKFMGLTDTSLETLQKVISQKTFTPRTPEELELLLTGHILEYTHPRKHFAVHPVLVPLIQEENKNLSVAHG